MNLFSLIASSVQQAHNVQVSGHVQGLSMHQSLPWIVTPSLGGVNHNTNGGDFWMTASRLSLGVRSSVWNTEQ